MQPSLDRREQVVVRGRLAGEEQDRRHVHVRAAGLEVEERGVQSGEAVAVGHGADSRPPGACGAVRSGPAAPIL